jgi:manganese/iron transport system substrate-binding protein
METILNRRYLNISIRNQKIIIAVVMAVGLITGCKTPNNKQANNPSPKNPKVLVTNSILCDLTKQIAANTIEVICLLPPGSDPHIYKLTAAARQSIKDAKLLLYGGYNFEPELIKTIKATSNPAPKLAVYEMAVPQPQQFAEDGKSTIDPHIWHNAQNGVKIAKTIAANLTKLVPAKAAFYQQNTQKLTTEIDRIDIWIRSQIETIPKDKKVLVTTHDALGYYATAYGISIASLEGVSTEEKPNAARTKELIDKIIKTKVPTIYVESSINPQLITTIANTAKVKVSPQKIYADGLGEIASPGGTYQKMLISNTRAIVEGLGGKYSQLKL